MSPSIRNRRNLRALLAACGLGLSALASSASAQLITWNTTNGAWNIANNWTGLNIPDTFAETAQIDAPGSYIVTHPAITTNIAGLNLLNPNALLNVDHGSTLRIATGGIVNNSRILLNTAGANVGTVLFVNNAFSLTGSGRLSLNAFPGNLDSSYIYFNGGGELLTQASSHTIDGSGNIYVFMDNSGTLNANIASRTLNLLSQPKTNRGLFTATNNGNLQLSSVTVNQPDVASRIVADGGTVSIVNSTVNNGRVESINSGQVSIIGTSTLTATQTSGAINVPHGNALRIANSLTNNASTVINSTGANSSTQYFAVNSHSLGGTGELVLNAFPGNLDSAYMYYNGGGEVVTQAASHTIRGTGNIHVSLTNNGLVSADVSGRILNFLAIAKQNNNLFQSINGGILRISSCTVTQSSSGEILGDNSTVELSNAVINGGTLDTTGLLGAINVSGTTTLTALTHDGVMNVLPGQALALVNSFHNDGLVTVNPTATNAATYIRFNNTQSLTGAGTIVLNANAGNIDSSYLYFNGGGEVLTQAATHTIRGTGSIYVNMVNNGSILADAPGRVLRLSSQPKTNNNLIATRNGGILSLETTISQSPTAEIQSLNSEVRTYSVINGGILNAIAPNGLFSTFSGTTLNNLTLNGRLHQQGGNSLVIQSGLVNNGAITINPAGINAGTNFIVLNTQTLSGTGQIILNANVGNLDSAYIIYNGGSEILTQSPQHTIRGTGNIYVNLTNNGTIIADVPGRALGLVSQPKLNNSLITSTNGASINISVSITQNAITGQIFANGGNVNLSSTVTNGLLSSANSGLFRTSGSATFTTLRNDAVVFVQPGTALRFAGAIENNGSITVNETGVNAGTSLNFLNSLTVSGSGRIVLNANLGNFDSGYLIYNGGGEVFTMGPDHSLEGNGRIYVRTQSQGTIAPGLDSAPIGLLNFAGVGRLTMAPTSSLEIQVGGSAPNQADRITSNLPIDLDGALRISLANGYIPSRGDVWTIVSGSVVNSGFFEFQQPPVISGSAFRINYYPNRVDLEVFCYADINGDGGIDGTDIEVFFTLWEAGDLLSDLNNDGGVDGSDIEVFFGYWEAGGC